MKTWVRKSISVGVMAAGGLLATQAAAQADVISNGNFGIGNGLQVVAPIQTAIDVCGNSIPIGASVGFAACDGGAQAGGGGVGNVVSSGNFGILNGLQVVAPVQTALDVCGNSIPIIASVGFAACNGGAQAGGESQPRAVDNDDHGYRKHHEAADEALAMAEGKSKNKYDGRGHGHGKGKHSDWEDQATNIVSSGNYGILNGLQVYAPIQTAIDICGNSIPLIASVGFAQCDGGAAAGGSVESARAEGAGGGDFNAITTNNFGLLNGPQVIAPIQTAVDICGNSIPILLSTGFAACDGGAAAGGSVESARVEGARTGGGGDFNAITTNNFGLLNGLQVIAPIQTAIDVCGNSIPVGLSAAFAQCDGGAAAGGSVESAKVESAKKEEALPVLGQLPVVAALPVVGQLGQSASPVAAATNRAPGARSAGATEGKYKDHDGRGRGHKDHDGRGRGNKGHDHDHDRGRSGGDFNVISSGNFGILNGVQVVTPIQTALDVSGNAIPILASVGFAQSNGGAQAG